MVVETFGRTYVPNSNLSTPPPTTTTNELVIVGSLAGVILQVTLIYILSLEMNKGGSNVLLTKIMSFFNHCYLKRSTVKVKFSLRNPQCNKVNMDCYLLSRTVIEHHRIFISIVSIILAEAEKSRLINVFQAFAMNKSLLTCLQPGSAEIRWVHMSLYYGGVDLIPVLGEFSLNAPEKYWDQDYVVLPIFQRRSRHTVQL